MKQHTASDIVFKSDLSTRARIVFMYLSYRSNKENTCFPSIKTIARECGMAVSTVKRALNDLDLLGYIEKNQRFRDDNGQTSNLYVLIEGKVRENVAVQEEYVPDEPIRDLVSGETQAHTEEKLALAASEEPAESENIEQPIATTSRQMPERQNRSGNERGGVQISSRQADSEFMKTGLLPAKHKSDSPYPTGEPPPSSIT